MKKLLVTLFTITFSLMLFAQEKIYTDANLDVQFTVEERTDEVNDVFYEYYSFEVSNISQNQVSFIPVFTYVTETGDQRSSANHDENNIIQLAPGETIKGNLTDQRTLTLFKQFTIGNSGKRAANSTYTIKTLTINYQ